MSEKPYNEPAFPILNDGAQFPRAEGMTLRDYFAGQELSKTMGTSICDEPALYDRLADHCYRMADAMLKARAS